MIALLALLALPISLAGMVLLLRSPRAVAAFSAPPRDDRWHTRPTPTFGGLAIFAGFALAVVAALLAGAGGTRGEVIAVLAGACVIFVFGLIDDVRHLPPLAKLGSQILAATIVLESGIRVEVFDNDTLAWAVGLIWLVGMANAFNLLDNMDGLATSLAVVSSGCFGIAAAFVNPNEDIVLLAVALGFAALGFLPFNFRPGRKARSFMGDSGSQVLGFVLAACGLMASYKVAGTTVATVALPLLVLAVPIFDTALVTVMRMAEGKPVTQGGRDHSSHRLVYTGLSEKRAVVLLVAVSAALGLTSLAYQVLDSARITAVGVLVTFALLVELAMFLADASTSDRDPHPFARHARVLGEIVVDGALIAAAFYAAYVVVIEGNGTPWQRHVFIVGLPILLASRYLTLLVLGLYRPGRPRAGAREAALITVGVAVSEPIALGVIDLTMPLYEFPMKVFLFDALLAALLIACGRFAERSLVALVELVRRPVRRVRVRDDARAEHL